MAHLLNAEGGGRKDAQKGNPAQGISDKALSDGHLTLREANEIYAANNDPNYRVEVDAFKLSVTQASGGVGNKVPGVVNGSDYLVHGQVTLRHRPNGTVGIYDGEYNFEYHDLNSAKDVLRNVETFVGKNFAGKGTSCWIRYKGNANVSN